MFTLFPLLNVEWVSIENWFESYDDILVSTYFFYIAGASLMSYAGHSERK
jgi:hypothetical protein